MVALPVLAAVLVALMALLLMYGIKEFGKAVAHIFPSSIGVSIASIHPRAWVEAGVDAIAAGISWILGDVIRPMINLILGPVQSIIGWFEALDYTIAHAAAAYADILDRVIPNTLYTAWKETVKYYKEATGYAYYVEKITSAAIIRWYGYATAYADKAVAAVEGTIVKYYDRAIAYADGIEKVTSAAIVRWYGYATAYTDRSIKALEGTVKAEVDAYAATAAADLAKALKFTTTSTAAALSTAEGYATTAATAAVGALTTDVGKSLDAVAQDVIDDTGSLVGVLGSDFPDVSGLLKQIDLTDLGSLAGGLVGALTITRALSRLAEDCTVPNCRNLSQFGRDLQALLGVVEGAAFLGFLAEMITSPVPTAGLIQDALGNTARDTASGVADLLGV